MLAHCPQQSRCCRYQAGAARDRLFMAVAVKNAFNACSCGVQGPTCQRFLAFARMLEGGGGLFIWTQNEHFRSSLGAAIMKRTRSTHWERKPDPKARLPMPIRDITPSRQVCQCCIHTRRSVWIASSLTNQGGSVSAKTRSSSRRPAAPMVSARAPRAWLSFGKRKSLKRFSYRSTHSGSMCSNSQRFSAGWFPHRWVVRVWEPQPPARIEPLEGLLLAGSACAGLAVAGSVTRCTRSLHVQLPSGRSLPAHRSQPLLRLMYASDTSRCPSFCQRRGRSLDVRIVFGLCCCRCEWYVASCGTAGGSGVP